MGFNVWVSKKGKLREMTRGKKERRGTQRGWKGKREEKKIGKEDLRQKKKKKGKNTWWNKTLQKSHGVRMEQK